MTHLASLHRWLFLWYIFANHTIHRKGTSMKGPVGPSSSRNNSPLIAANRSLEKKDQNGVVSTASRRRRRKDPARGAGRELIYLGIMNHIMCFVHPVYMSSHFLSPAIYIA
jgi:hypothetical protein